MWSVIISPATLESFLSERVQNRVVLVVLVVPYRCSVLGTGEAPVLWAGHVYSTPFVSATALLELWP